MDLRVLIVASFSPSIRNFRGLLIAAMLRRGHEVHVAAPGLTSDVETVNWLTHIGVKHHDIFMARTGTSPLQDIRSLIDLLRLILRIKPDLYFAYTIKPVVWGLLAASSIGIKRRVAFITGLGYAFVGKATGRRIFVRRVVEVLYSISVRRATLIIFQNDDDLFYFEENNFLSPKVNRIVVNGSGVDLRQFALASRFRDKKGQSVRFLMIARLLVDKGLREYAKAAALLAKDFPGVECHLVGGFDTNPNSIAKNELFSWIDQGHIIWHGATADVRPFIKNCDVYVLPSYREGMPRTVLEAMAIGRPIITTYAPGCRSTVLDGESGFLVPVMDVLSLVEAMSKFVENPDLIDKMGLVSRRLAEEKFDVHKVNKIILDAMDL